MIIDEKVINPPPPYTKAHSPPPGPPGGGWRTLSALPPHLLLSVVYASFSDAYDIEDAKEQRKTLYWLAVSLRLVNRAFYTTSMNVLRSIYIPLYDSLIRPPYTSDPFPFAHSSPSYTPPKSPASFQTQFSSSSRTSLTSLQRETSILDLFIALKVREDVWADDSDLHLSRAEPTFTDLFSLMQPRARLDDLVREYGVAEGVLYIDRRRSGSRTPGASSVDLRTHGERDGPTSVVLRSAASYAALTQRLAAESKAASSSSGSSFWRGFGGKGKSRAPTPPTPLPSQKVTVHPLPFSAVSTSFSSRRVGLVLTIGGGSGSGWSAVGGSGIGKRTIVEVPRTRDEALEVAARRLVWELRDWLVDAVDGV